MSFSSYSPLVMTNSLLLKDPPLAHGKIHYFHGDFPVSLR